MKMKWSILDRNCHDYSRLVVRYLRLPDTQDAVIVVTPARHYLFKVKASS